MIVYPGESPELPKALAEAEAKGVPVILLEKGVAAPEGSKPFTVVEYGPFDSTAKQIVSATIEDLTKAKLPVNGTAIVLADRVVDSTSARRVAALKAAAESAKFKKVVTVEIDGRSEADSKRMVLEAVKANPDVSVVLTDDGEGLVAAATVRSDLRGKPIFFVGGYTDFRSSPISSPPVRESCYVEGRFSELGALAVLTALAKLNGEAVGEHAFLTTKFSKTEGAVSTEENPNPAFPEIIRNIDRPEFLKAQEDAKQKAEASKKDAAKPQ